VIVPHPYDELPFRRDELKVGVYRDIAFERRWQSRDLRTSDPDGARLLETIADAYEMRAKALHSEIIEAKLVREPHPHHQAGTAAVGKHGPGIARCTAAVSVR